MHGKREERGRGWVSQECRGWRGRRDRQFGQRRIYYSQALGAGWEGKRRRGCSLRSATERRRLPSGVGAVLGAGDGTRAGRERLSKEDGEEQREAKGWGSRRNRQVGRVRGNGLQRRGSYCARTDSGAPSCRADFSSLGPLETSQTCHCGQDYFPVLQRHATLALLLTYLQLQDKSLTSLNVNPLFHSGLGGWDEMRRLKGICNPLFKG